jgi:hypothetical protein
MCLQILFKPIDWFLEIQLEGNISAYIGLFNPVDIGEDNECISREEKGQIGINLRPFKRITSQRLQHKQIADTLVAYPSHVS